MSAQKIDQWALAALWMRAVANGCGYTPSMAMPLAIAYTEGRKRPALYKREACGDLRFAGMTFLEPQEDRVVANGRTYKRMDYDINVLHHFPGGKPMHDDLFYVAVESAALFPVEKADGSPIAWDRFTAALGTRTKLTPQEAKELLGGIRP
jgi:hypothetical protein